MENNKITLKELTAIALEVVDTKNISNDRVITISTGKNGVIEQIKAVYNINEEVIKEAELLLPEGWYIFKSSLKDGCIPPNGKSYFSIFDYIEELKNNR